MVRHRDEFPRDIPIVYCCAPALMTNTLDIPSDIPASSRVWNAGNSDGCQASWNIDWPGTLALAQRLQPNAKTLVIISGASDLDRRREQEMMRALQPFLQKYDIRYLTGLPYDELLKQVSRLPRNSIVFLGAFSRMVRAGPAARSSPKTCPRRPQPPFILRLPPISDRASSAAAWRVSQAKGPRSRIWFSTSCPAKTLRHFRIKPGFRFNIASMPGSSNAGDSAQASLPPGTFVEFRQPTLWEQHRNTVILVLLAFAVLVGFIALLLIEIRKRQKAEEVGKTAAGGGRASAQGSHAPDARWDCQRAVRWYCA